MDPSEENSCLVETRMPESLSQLIAPQPTSSGGPHPRVGEHPTWRPSIPERRQLLNVLWAGRTPRDGTPGDGTQARAWGRARGGQGYFGGAQ